MANQEVMRGMSDPDKILSATVKKEELYNSLQAHHHLNWGRRNGFSNKCDAVDVWKEITVYL